MFRTNPAKAPVILIDNYDSFTYNLFQMVQALTDHPVVVYRNDALDFESLKALKPNRIIFSPGPGHPAVDSDFGLCKDVILRHQELKEDSGKSVPVLGVCLGHQGMIHHSGGQVVRAPEIMHGKTSQIKLEAPSPLLEGLSNPFEAMRYHSLIAADEGFPPDWKITAREVLNGFIMAIQHDTKPLYGVQFHPESIGTPEGSRLLQNFIEKC